MYGKIRRSSVRFRARVIRQPVHRTEPRWLQRQLGILRKLPGTRQAPHRWERARWSKCHFWRFLWISGLCPAGQNGVSTTKIQIVTIVLVPNDEVLGGFPVTSRVSQAAFVRRCDGLMALTRPLKSQNKLIEVINFPTADFGH